MTMQTDFLTAGLLSQIDAYVQRASNHVKEAKTAQLNDPSVMDVWFDISKDEVVFRKSAELVEPDVPEHWCGLAFSCGRAYFVSSHRDADRLRGV